MATVDVSGSAIHRKRPVASPSAHHVAESAPVEGMTAFATDAPGIAAGLAGAVKSRALAALIDRDHAVARAIASLVEQGLLTGLRSRKVSTRVDPGLMEAAKQRFGLTNDSDVINASLAMAAAPDRFKAWLRDSEDMVTEGFDLAV